jgi:hypothetical protein
MAPKHFFPLDLALMPTMLLAIRLERCQPDRHLVVVCQFATIAGRIQRQLTTQTLAVPQCYIETWYYTN